VSTVLLFADQNLMSPNLTAMARDFGFDDQQRDQKLGGDIALAFFVLGAPASLVVGCLADTYNRARLLALCVALGEGACLATYAVRTYRQLYVCRAVTGVALGGALPLIYSVLGDLYAAEDRHMVNAIVGIGTGVGISVGQGVAGFLGPTWGWRLPFVVISVPALVCAALVLFTVQDPPRGRMEAAVLASSSSSHGTPRPSPASLSSLPVEMIPLQIDEERATRRPSLCRDKAEDDEEEEDAPEILSSSTMTHPGLLSYWKTFTSLVSTPTVIFTLLQGAPGCVPWGIINSFLNDFLSENRGMSVEVRRHVL
jgi:MFS family permease